MKELHWKAGTPTRAIACRWIYKRTRRGLGKIVTIDADRCRVWIDFGMPCLMHQPLPKGFSPVHPDPLVEVKIKRKGEKQ